MTPKRARCCMSRFVRYLYISSCINPASSKVSEQKYFNMQLEEDYKHLS